MKILIITSVVLVLLLIIFFFFIPQAANLESKDGDSIQVQELNSPQEELIQERDKKGKYVESQILVKFKKEVSETEVADFIEEYNLKVLDIIVNIRVYQFEIISDISVEAMVDELSGNSLVEYAEPNYVIEFKI
ncbi:MAG: hypothetical protein P9X27_01845 [Candidatus Kaelpia aquatica]|nr:hypothetical protein [Candidatus Kaelpia aquatica]